MNESGMPPTEQDQDEMIGSCPCFQQVLDRVRIVAPTDSAILVQGETGTGKEMIARAIHQQSARRSAPLVKVDCTAIPGPLLESELFGHERGAFTGACTQTQGLFQAAERGTLFLDEVGELPLELQPKLLRAVQDHEFARLGSSRIVRVNVRVVAATNRDLGKLVKSEQFRADLYYRLNVIPIRLPPLRERTDDIPALVEHFVRKFASRTHKTIDVIPAEAIEVLKLYDWPGNIRELQNFIERSVILSSGSVLRPILEELTPMTPQQSEATRTLVEAERDHILEVLNQTSWLIGGRDGAATRLGLPRSSLVYKMRKLGIDRGAGLPEPRRQSQEKSQPLCSWYQ